MSFGFETHLPGQRGNMDFAGDDYGISLPHQCDSWVITASPDRETALAEVRKFRDELDQAIAEIEKESSDGIGMGNLRERLGRISDWHARETGPAGTVGDFCTECGRRWPCDSRRMADGTYVDEDEPVTESGSA